MGFLSTAQTLGFFSPRLRDALTFAEKSSPTSKPNEINIAAMQAFATDISAFGQVNLFESNYQSKLEIINQICELTGFEFYQDVDGDFVFKPPLYNLDTSSSRVYRIEAIDIISFNHSSKEPEVTYMTVKGSHFRNIRGLGLDNEWGVKGQYIDYRLVAQFGWRPGSFDTTFFTDGRSMFFAAINRMDIMNAGINSASVTIPIRPEIRPGYPVYIPKLDCYYYVQSISHGFQFGSQCTTTLQLTARRAKFYAPGDVAKTGVDAINLGNMILPQKPLLVQGEGGVPRYSGFPNVVMALDPNKVNPLFFVVGSDIENIASPQTLQNLLASASTANGVLSSDTNEAGQTFYFLRQNDKNNQIRFFLEPPRGKKLNGVTQIDLLATARNLTSSRTSNAKRIRSQNRELALLDRRINRLDDRRNRLSSARRPNTRAISALETQIRTLTNTRNNKAKSFANAAAEAKKKLESDPSIKTLLSLIDTIKSEFLKRNKDYQDANSASNLLDLLSDKKASFSNGKLPGSYRYYSASHPDPKHQGQPELVFDDSQIAKNQTATNQVTQRISRTRSARKIR
ncbi:MAG: hypothetical protein AAGM67_05925, partial [Bacteroidota bacterium]